MLDDAKRRVLEIVEHLSFLRIELVLREPEPEHEHLEDMRELVAMGGL